MENSQEVVMDSISKLNITLFVILCLMVMFGKASADHTTGMMAGAPKPVQECYAKAQLYQQLVTTRQAGLTREEVSEYSAFTMRIVKYVTERAGEEYDDAEEVEYDEKATEVYAISEEDLASNVYLNDWIGVKYTACVDLIPDEIILDEDDAQSIDRMLPPE
jgi:hypothetical protein